ncbi:MAG: saccharopine dehydrogenase NADP-binding domain-containing protein [Gammaproteobacteria bacterium]
MSKSKAQKTPSRPYHVVVYGATGFTGKLTAEYLATCGDKDHLKWAIAGRNLQKLESCKQAILQLNPSADVAIIQADTQDPASLKQMAEQTLVVISTVGPYLNYGEPLVKACIDAGTHYVDLTGEPEFVDGLTHDYHDQAEAKGVKIVNACGFDSVPHDLGALYTLNALNQLLGPERAGKVPVKIEGFVEANGTFSGGTWHSAITQFSRLREYAGKRKIWQQKAKSKPSDRRRTRVLSPIIKRCKAFGAWAIPLPTIDPQVVKRTAAERQEFGPDFGYGHYVLTRSLPKGLAGIAAAGGLVALAQVEYTRNKLLKVKDPGQGPSAAQRQKSWFKVHFVGEAAGMHVWTEVSGGDPGYGETAKMLAESALCLALDKNLPAQFGVVTTGVAMGEALIARLQKAGIDFRTL